MKNIWKTALKLLNNSQEAEGMEGRERTTDVLEAKVKESKDWLGWLFIDVCG